MMTAFRGWSLGCVISGALLSAIPAFAQDAEGVVRLGDRSSVGAVRISDQTANIQTFRAQSQEPDSGSPANVTQMSHCETEYGAAAGTGGVNCPPAYVENCRHHGCKGCKECQGRRGSLFSWFHNDLATKGTWFHGKCEGHGPARPLAGCYHIVYPVDPGYFDQRDGQVYAAPGYGGPVSVPLAPVVNHTYNYGWGVPSSRLTPVLHPATQTPVSQIPGPYQTAPVSY